VPSPADLPSGAALEGNQARWIRKDFEPGPEDDFAIWLLRPDKWQELESARLAVKANPDDGRAWLDLASTYVTLSCAVNTYSCSLFSSTYLPLGIEAYQKAAELLPENPTPHTGLGLLRLTMYLQDKNAPPEIIQSILGELQIARELEAKNPSLAREASFSSWDLADALKGFFMTEFATETAEAILLATPPTTPATQASLTASPTEKITHTATPIPSTTPQPPPTTPPTTTETRGTNQSLVITVVIGVIILVVVGFLIWKRMKKSAGM
jgi:hypothetical protein